MTARVVVMMTEREKQAIEQRARGMKLTTSELVRRAAQGYEEINPVDESALELLADELEQTVVSMRASLERARQDTAFHEAEMARIKASA